MALPTRPTSDPTWATSGANRASIDSAKRVEGFVGGGGADNGTVNTLWGVLGDWITFLGGVTPATGVIDCYTIRGVGVANSQPIDLQILDNGGGGILIEGTGATATTRLLATGGANDIGLTLTPSTGTALLDGDNVTIRGTRAGGEVVVRVSGGASNSDITFDRDTGDITMTGGAAVDFTSGTTLDMTATGDLTLSSSAGASLSAATAAVDSTTLTGITSDTAVVVEAPSVSVQTTANASTLAISAAGNGSALDISAVGTGTDITIQATGGADDASIVLDVDTGNIIADGALLRVTAVDVEMIGSGSVAITPDGFVTVQSVTSDLTLEAAGVMTTAAGNGQIGGDATASSNNGVFPMVHRLVVASGGSASHTSIDFDGEIIDWHIVVTDSNTGTVALATTSGGVNTLTIGAPASSTIVRGDALVLANKAFTNGDAISVTSSSSGPACIAYVTTLRTS